MSIRVKVEVIGEGGFELPAANIPKTVPESRLLRLPVGAKLPVVGSYTLKGGRYMIKKSPSTSLVYGVDLRDYLLDAGATLAAVVIEDMRGVAALDKAFINGTVIGVLVGGLAAVEGAPNTITLRFICQDGQSDSVTIGFEKG